MFPQSTTIIHCILNLSENNDPHSNLATACLLVGFNIQSILSSQCVHSVCEIKVNMKDYKREKYSKTHT